MLNKYTSFTMLSPQSMHIRTAQEMVMAYGDGKLPVDPAAIAHAAGVIVKSDDSLVEQGVSGHFELTDGEAVIYFNPAESRLRNRFTIAHELGHFVLNHGNRFRDTAKNFASIQFDPIETQANQFATELLMPAGAVNFLIEKRNITDFLQLTQLFDVSQQAMQYRLQKLGWLG